MAKACKLCGGDVHRGAKTGVCRTCFDTASQAAKPVITESFTVRGNRAEISKLSRVRIKTLAQLVAVCEIDTNEWEIERHTINKTEQTAMPRAVGESKQWARKTTKPILTQMFHIKAWLRRKTAVIAAREEIAALIAAAKQAMPPRPFSMRGACLNIKRALDPSLFMLEISIPDLHVGKLAWGKETGHASYDTKIALQAFDDALEALVARTSSYRFDQIVFIVGNDLFNADNKQNTTTRGTPQDTDSRFPKTFVTVRTMMVDAVSRLRQVAPVKVLIVPGNHDTLAAYHLGDSLSCYFHGADGIEIDNAPTMRKYHRFGNNMLMWTHGDKGKLADLPLLMATEQPEMFGATLFREAHTGDKHHLRVNEYHGVRVRISPALCAPDAWHSENHYVGAQRAAEAFVYHATEGLVGTAVYTVPEPKETK